MSKKVRKVYRKRQEKQLNVIDMPQEIYENTIKMLNSTHQHFDHTPAGRLGQANLLSDCSTNSTQPATSISSQKNNTIKNQLTKKEQEIQSRCRKRIKIAEGTYEQYCRLDKFEPGTLFDIFGELKKCQEQQNWKEFSELILLSMDKITYFSELDFLVNYMLSAVLYDPKCGASGRRESIIQGIIDTASSNKDSELFLKNLCCKENMRLTDLINNPQEKSLDDLCTENTNNNNVETCEEKDVIIKSIKKTPGGHRPKRYSRRRSISRNSKRIKLNDSDDDELNQQNDNPIIKIKSPTKVAELKEPEE